MTTVIVQGSGDVGSAIAHQLFLRGAKVIISDEIAPAHLRRRMSFVDAYYQGFMRLEGVSARYVIQLPSECPEEVLACSLNIEALLAQTKTDIVIDARMQKKAVPILPAWKNQFQAPLVGLGPGFCMGINCDLAIETAWGESLGGEVIGSTKPLEGEPRPIDGFTRKRFVYAPKAGTWNTTQNIGDVVQAEDVLGHIGGDAVMAPMSGILKGISHHGSYVKAQQKIIEIDPSGNAQLEGIGERPRKIAQGVVNAIKKRGWGRTLSGIE